MIFIAYILIFAACCVMVYFGHLQGTSQFYMTIFSATIICYCVYLDYKKRAEKKSEEKKNTRTITRDTKNKKAASDISKIAHKSTKDKKSAE